MQIPIQITFRDMDHSGALEQLVRERARKLETLSAKIMGCRVALEAPHRHSHQADGRYHVRIDLTVPGDEIVLSHTSGEDMYVAVNQAFQGAQRRLKEHFGRRRVQARHD
jgi:ribosomal subunit interface protein